VASGAAALTAREALALATRGGARVLGRDDIGAIVPGKAADVIAFDLDAIAFAGGAEHDPLAALLFCAPAQVAISIVDGRIVVRDGALTTLELPRLVHRQRSLARALANAR